MIKKITRLLITMLPLILACSDLEDSTGLGRDIVSSYNPSAVNIDQNFQTFYRNNSIVTDAFSIPDQNNTRFGIHTGVIAAGSKEGYTTTGFTEFVIGKNVGRRFQTKDKLVAISLSFDTISFGTRSLETHNLTLYSCSQNKKYSRTSDPTGMLIGKLVRDTSSKKLNVEIEDSDLAQSIFDACLAYQECLDDCPDKKDPSCTNPCDSLKSTFSFCLFNENDSSFVRLRSPVMKIAHKRTQKINKKDSVITRIDSLTGASYSNYIAFEDDIGEVKDKPLSSSASERTAVFQIDISSLWDTMSTTGFNEILSAGLELRPLSYENLDKKDSLFSVRHYLSDELIQDGIVLDSLIGSGKLNIEAEYDKSGKMTNSIILFVDRHLQSLRSTRPSTVYLYIQVNKFDDVKNISWERVEWRKPVFNVVLSTFK
ncbi:MAG: hypothetical protein GX556_09080 [Fibrobacter sp.]|nr:hypothetical protein [Fibrobacter sp.]